MKKSYYFGQAQTNKTRHSMRTFLLVFGLILIISVISVDAKEAPFNYSFSVRNQSTLGLVTNANCNITIITTDPEPLIGNGPVVATNFGNGSYGLRINESWTQGNYATEVQCSASGFTNKIFGNFVVGLETTDFRDMSIVGTVLIIATLFLYLAFRSEDRVLNPLFFFLGNLMIVVNFFLSAELTTSTEISSVMRSIYAPLIILYAGGFMMWVFVGYFYPFVMKYFVKRGMRTDDEVEADVD